jgi:hypothetical protein
MCWHKDNLIIYNYFYSQTRTKKSWYVMTQIQITNQKSNNLLGLIDSTWVLHEIILKFRHLKYMRSAKIKAFLSHEILESILPPQLSPRLFLLLELQNQTSCTSISSQNHSFELFVLVWSGFEKSFVFFKYKKSIKNLIRGFKPWKISLRF